MGRKKYQAHSTLLMAGLTVVLFAAGCSGGRGTTGTATDGDVQRDVVRMSDYEDFDAAPYTEEEPEMQTAVDHDVPENLMTGRADQGVERVIQGYRIQIYQSLDKAQAIEQEEAAIAWWDDVQIENRPEGLFEDGLPAYLDYRQPYYRVRIGDFLSREDAERAARVVGIRFPGSFIAPDVVTVTR